MTDAMLHSHYPLQALLYSVVLHRYLRWRVPDYDPERHLGGILYLYVRGMCGPETPEIDGQPCGVFAWHPPAAMVVELSELTGRRGEGGGVVIDDPHTTAGSRCRPLACWPSSTAPTSCRRPTSTSPRGWARCWASRATTSCLAVALAVRAVRNGSVCVDLATVAELPAEDDVDARHGRSQPAGPIGSRRARCVSEVALVCDEGRLYLDRYWREEGDVCDDLLARLAREAPRARRGRPRTRASTEPSPVRVTRSSGRRRRPRPSAGPPSSPAARAPARPPRWPACWH